MVSTGEKHHHRPEAEMLMMREADRQGNRNATFGSKMMGGSRQ